MSDQVYILLHEHNYDSKYNMNIYGVFTSLELAVRSLLLAMTNSTTEEECLSSIVNMENSKVLNYTAFSIKKATLDNMIDHYDEWRYALVPMDKGFYLIRTKIEQQGPISCKSENREQFMIGCSNCIEHDVEFTFSSNFLDRLNEIWIDRAYHQNITRSTQIPSDYEIPPNAIKDVINQPTITFL